MADPSGARSATKTSIRIDFYYRGIRCKEYIKLPPTPANLKYARLLKQRIKHEIATGEFDYAKHFPDSPRLRKLGLRYDTELKVAEYLAAWIEVEAERIEPSTLVGYRKILKYHLIPSFGHMKLTDLQRKDLYAWTDAHPKLSTKRIANVLSPLRVAYEAAMKRDLITDTPFEGFRIGRRRKKNVEDVDPFSAAEREAILRTVTEPQVYNLVQFAFWTGLRTSELIGLDWSDIDWIKGTVRISRRFTEGMTEPERGTKTDAGYREVVLLPPALEALQSQKAHTFLKDAEVFQRPRQNARWDGDYALRHRMWIPLLKRAGVRYRNPYQTRHTYASMMLMAGENVMWVARQMGHKDWSLTARRYSRWIPSDMPDAGKKAAEKWADPAKRMQII